MPLSKSCQYLLGVKLLLAQAVLGAFAVACVISYVQYILLTTLVVLLEHMVRCVCLSGQLLSNEMIIDLHT